MQSFLASTGLMSADPEPGGKQSFPVLPDGASFCRADGARCAHTLRTCMRQPLLPAQTGLSVPPNLLRKPKPFGRQQTNTSSSGSRCLTHRDEHFAGVVAAEDADEGARGVLKALDNIFAVL